MMHILSQALVEPLGEFITSIMPLYEILGDRDEIMP